jgi:hypothetical protein
VTDHKPWREGDGDWLRITKNAAFRRSRIDHVERVVSPQGSAVTYSHTTAVDASDATDFYPKVMKYRVYANGLMREYEAAEVLPGALDDYLEPLESL